MAEFFAEAGHDAVTVFDQQMGEAEDPDLAPICLREGRILMTLDTAFTDVRAYPPQHFPGIVVFRLSRQSRDYLLEIGTSLLLELTTSLRGQLWIAEDSRIRIRE